MNYHFLGSGLMAATLVVGIGIGRDCGGLRDRAHAMVAEARTTTHHYSPHDTKHDGGLFGAYHATSPHWPHIRTMVTDFRTTWLPNKSQRAAEVAWAAAHFDYVMSGPVSEYKARNPALGYFPYALQWTVLQPKKGKAGTDLTSGYYEDMLGWFASHPEYHLEDAFLHTAGAPKSPASRVTVHIWDSDRWAINPGDRGARAYQVDRAKRVTRNTDGIFFDEHASADVRGRINKVNVLEYPGFTGYERDVCEVLREIHAAVAPKILLLNTSEYMKPFDVDMILAAGGAHLEKMNNPLHGDMQERWKFIEDLLSKGVTVEMVSANSWSEADKLGSGFDAGSYASRGGRLKMWELASYYLVVPENPDHLLIDMEAAWKEPFDKMWLKAQEVNIGHPTEDRHVYQDGKDATGHTYRIWARNFDRALVLVRPRIGWDTQSYGPETAVKVPLPTGVTWRPLREDGTLGEPVRSVMLSNPESAILVRER
ncbi:MAG TPA: hypothetical protein VFS44_15700 [Gemmatimonadaceae bacterium]|nr:hypothetical protein [Gemmatimonadaceae bacterium]